MRPVVTEAINFLHELDLLEVHLDEHCNFIDRIIVVESEVTYSGMYKPLYFEKNKERFKRFNVEHEVIPKDMFVPIPASYGEEEGRKWFNARRNNRETQQRYIFSKYKVDSDYICNTDTDEVWSRDSWFIIKQLMKDKEYCYIAPLLCRLMFFMDYHAGNEDHWRIARSDMETHVRQKGFKRIRTPELGWHFNSIYKDPSDLWMKAVGLAQSLGYYGWAKVPSPEELSTTLNNGILPFLYITIKPKKVMNKEDLSWAPLFIRNNPDKFPWLPDKYKANAKLAKWKPPIEGK